MRRLTKRDYIRHKETARALVHKRLLYWNNHYNLTYHRVSIKNHKTRWGSCSKKGNLNFNFRLIFLPLELLDYLVVHELCHLQEFNHSENFWNLVKKTIPDYKKLRHELRNKYLL
jgi:predicted metal-dependent hydrolase